MILGDLGGFQRIHPTGQPCNSHAGGGLTMLTVERKRAVSVISSRPFLSTYK
jgi:hypothetical protein